MDSRSHRSHWRARSSRNQGSSSESRACRATDRSLPNVAAADGRVKKRHDRAKPVTVSLTSARSQTSKGLIEDISHHFPSSSAHCSTGRVQKKTDAGFSGYPNHKVKRKMNHLSSSSSSSSSSFSSSSSLFSSSSSSPSSPSSLSTSSSFSLSSSSFSSSSSLSSSLHQERVVALDCEMVGITARKLSALGRCSIVQYDGEVIFDEFIQPDEPITDYRTQWSGITRSDMRNALPIKKALKKIHRILRNKIVVGHALHHDFDVLKYSHPYQDTRDTSKYVPVRVLAGTPKGRTPSLKNLAANLLSQRIQQGSHCSVVDATAALDIYKLVEQRWEKEPLSVLRRYTPRMMKSKKRIKKTNLKLKVAKKKCNVK